MADHEVAEWQSRLAEHIQEHGPSVVAVTPPRGYTKQQFWDAVKAMDAVLSASHNTVDSAPPSNPPAENGDTPVSKGRSGEGSDAAKNFCIVHTRVKPCPDCAAARPSGLLEGPADPPNPQ